MVRDLDLLVATALSPLVKRLRAMRPPPPASTVVLPAVRPGGFGDQAVVNAARSALAILHPSAPFAIAAHEKGDAGSWGVRGSREIDVSSWFARPRLRGWLAASRMALDFERLVFVGTDVFDGTYSSPDCWVRLLRAADRLGMDSRVVSFSFSNSPASGAVRTLRRLPRTTRLFPRDPISQRRVEEYLQRPVDPSADLAFLLPIDEKPSRRLVDREEVLSHSGSRIGLNINAGLVQRACNLSLEECVQAACRLVGMLAAEHDAIVVLIPHDFRGSPNELEVAHMIARALPRSQADRCALSTARSAGEVKKLSSGLDLVISGRMHLAVAALGVGTPVVCADYQDKVEGLFERCGVPELVFPAALFGDVPVLAGFASDALKRHSEIAGALRSKAAQIEQLALDCLR